MEPGTCGGCGAPILWAITVKGKRIPLNLPENRFVLLGNDKMAVVKTYLGHHVTCPNRDQYRKPKEVQHGEG